MKMGLAQTKKEWVIMMMTMRRPLNQRVKRAPVGTRQISTLKEEKDEDDEGEDEGKEKGEAKVPAAAECQALVPIANKLDKGPETETGEVLVRN